jgi:hypothetical protein
VLSLTEINLCRNKQGPDAEPLKLVILAAPCRIAFSEKRTAMVEWQNDLRDTLGCRDANIVAARLAVTFALAGKPIDERRATACWIGTFLPMLLIDSNL